MFLHFNYEHFSEILPQIPSKDIRKQIPSRFTQRDADMKGADTAIDIQCVHL